MSNYTKTIKELLEENINIFDFEYKFYNDIEGSKELFETKFLDVFMFHEIGFDDVDIFKHYLKTKLNVLEPYYRKLYNTELASQEINFLLNKDLKETITRELIETGNKVNELTSTVNNDFTQSNNETLNVSETSSNEIHATLSDDYNSTNNSNSKDSTINNGISSVELENGFLTGVQATTGGEDYNLLEENQSTSNNSGEHESTKTNTLTNEGNQVVDTEESENVNNSQSESTTLLSQGNIGITSSAELLEKWRNVLIDVDMMLLNDLATLFLKVF